MSAGQMCQFLTCLLALALALALELEVLSLYGYDTPGADF
jgi:hypothetical protein